MASRKDMHAALKNIVVPHLRIWGFKGTYPHFRRIGLTHTDLLSFQFDSKGRDLFIGEITQAPGSGTYTTRWGEQYKMDEVKYFQVTEPRYRLQPGLRGLTETWFDYSQENYEDIAHSLLPYIETARNYFADNSRTEGLTPLFGVQSESIGLAIRERNQREYERLIDRLAAIIEDYKKSEPATKLRIDKVSQFCSKIYCRVFICALEVAYLEVPADESVTPGLRMIMATQCLEFKISTNGEDLWWFTNDLPFERRRMNEVALAAFILEKCLLAN